MAWDLTPPPMSNLHDQGVSLTSDKLKDKNIALLICGSIAAYDTPNLIRELRRHGASVQPFASSAALDFVTPMALEWTSGKAAICSLTSDAEHLGGNTEFDIYLIAPASYNTINKFAQGIADSAITVTLASALGLMEQGKADIFISPCMHGSMHNNILIENMQKLQNFGVTIFPPRQEDGKNKLPAAAELAQLLINEYSQ